MLSPAALHVLDSIADGSCDVHTLQVGFDAVGRPSQELYSALRELVA